MDHLLKWYVRLRYPQYRKAYRLTFDPDGFHHYPFELKAHLKGLSKDTLVASLRKDLATYAVPGMNEELTHTLEALAEGILTLPYTLDFITELIATGRLSRKSKMILLAIIAYLVSPVDVIPEGALRGAGYADDVIFASIALNEIVLEAERQEIAEAWGAHRGHIEHLYTVSSFARENLAELHKQVLTMYKRIFI
jgi:uncharacterized membrane protein YkvA (DUF1232 family)